MTSLPIPPRRLALSWTGLLPADAEWLDALARRVFGPIPLAVLDPTARNLLEGAQSQGLGPVASVWELVGPGALAQQSDRTVVVTAAGSGAVLRWLHPYWAGWPIVAGKPVTFTTSMAPTAGTCALYWVDAAGVILLTLGGTGNTITATPPAGAVYVRPAVLLSPTTTPTPIGPALLRIAADTPPGPLGTLGDGCPAMTVTGYTDRPTATARDLSLTLVEVRRARS
ncbi:hypothetical protein [Umezawaea sp. Da 62-37]|uniref:hypothetical protein n=1 Tax=Umezawaea sp. Da 62-37 TaxID=3075927 RepID=UPI0028F6F489|nr:hypothetical protein [Umezawaea sp. Da 62-37]WNV82208.1 hypothetical protein RM788_28820 [Umezawaea sp. Da 62-37]